MADSGHTLELRSGKVIDRNPMAAPPNLKPPKFAPFRNNPANWFSQLDKYFELYKIVDNTTKVLTISSLISEDTDTAREIEQCFSDLSSSYDSIKEQVINQLTTSNEEKLQILMSGLKLGDRKPSVLMKELKSNAPGNNDTIKLMVRMAFLNALPSAISLPLATQKTKDLDELARTADQLYSLQNDQKSVEAIDEPKNNPSNEKVLEEVAALRKEIASKFNRRRGGFKRNSNRNRGPQLCYYHRTFGSSAYKCGKDQGEPCDFNKNLN